MGGPETPVLHLVTSRRRLAPDARTEREATHALERFLVDAIDAGVDAIQIREPDLDAGLLLDVTRAAVRHAAGTPTRVLVNERADVARAADAAGVHLPAAGMRADRIRALDARWMVGRSTHAGGAVDDTALDYVMFGTVFPSESKPTQASVAGIPGLRAVMGTVRTPVIAIGGVTPARVSECRAAGAAGIAAIGVFLPPGRARDAMGVHAAVEALRARW